MADLFETAELPFDWQMFLAGREGVNQHPGWMVKRAGRDMASIETTEVKTDAKNMTATGVLSTPRLDQSRDIVVGLGIDTSIHRTNPLALLMHQHSSPIGRFEDKYGMYTVQTGDSKTVGTIHFFPTIEGEQAFRLVEMKALPGMSVGIRPKPRLVRQKSDASGMNFCVIEGCWLIEASAVYFPDNPDCLIVAVQKGLGGKPLVPSLKEMFMSMLPETKPIVNGATLDEDWIDGVKKKAAEGTALSFVEEEILKASPKVQACVSRKIPIIKRENPKMEMAQVEAIAYSMCGEKKKAADHPEPDTDPDADEDDRPLGAQYMAAHHEMVMAQHEFAEENEKRLEPEVAKELEDLHEHRTRQMDYLADKYNKRYPHLPPLRKSDDEEDGEPKDEDESKEKAQINDYRKKARAYVRQFWSERMKKLKTSDHAVIGEVAQFLNDLAGMSSSQLTRTIKAAAMHHAKTLKKVRETIAEQKEPEALQLEELAKKLRERAETMKVK